MKRLLFSCPENFAEPEMLRAVHAIALDGSIHPARATQKGHVLEVLVPDIDNLRLCIPWTIPGITHQLITTGTLMLTDTPYHLSVELARGLCNVIRNLAADWDLLGLKPPEKYQENMLQAGHCLIKAALLAHDTAEWNAKVDDLANISMQFSSKAEMLLLRGYTERILQLRQSARNSQESTQELRKLENMQATLEQNVLLNDDDVSAILNHMESSQDIVLNAVDELDFSPEDTALHSMGSLGMKQIGIATDYRPIEKELKGLFFQTFNSMTLGISWKELDAYPQLWETMQAQVRWCYSNGFPLTFGPLVNFSKEHLPQKVLDMKGHFEDICLCVRGYVEQIVKRFRPYVGAWIATSCVNSCFDLGLTVMEQLEITAQVMQLIHELHPTSEVTTSFDQPWGDNILPSPLGAAESASNTMSPLECADLLLQAKLKISAFRLEFNVGYGTHATYNRHPAQWIRLLERWSLFGKPLFLSFSVPSSCNADEKARFHTVPLWDGWTPKQQTQWAAIVLPALMAKPSVAGIDWNGLRDYRTHDYPHGGLISTTGHVKKVQALLAELQKYFSNET